MHRALIAIAWWTCALPGCPDPDCDAYAFDLEPDEATGPLMRPGDNCLRCHREGAIASRHAFSFAGTVFAAADADRCETGVEGVTISVTDADGRTVSVVSNAAGNFFAYDPIVPPLRMRAELDGRVAEMPIEAPTGACALCHRWPDPTAGALGRIRAP